MKLYILLVEVILAGKFDASEQFSVVGCLARLKPRSSSHL